MRILVLMAMLYGLWDLHPAHAQPASPRCKSVYADWYNGARPLSGVKCKAYIVPPIDSTGIATNTFNGSVYSIAIPVDTASSNAAGRVTIRVPLSSDLAPAGSRWRLVYEYLGRPLFDTQNLPTPNLSLTDTTTTCLQKATGATSVCP